MARNRASNVLKSVGERCATNHLQVKLLICWVRNSTIPLIRLAIPLPYLEAAILAVPLIHLPELSEVIVLNACNISHSIIIVLRSSWFDYMK